MPDEACRSPEHPGATPAVEAFATGMEVNAMSDGGAAGVPPCDGSSPLSRDTYRNSGFAHSRTR